MDYKGNINLIIAFQVKKEKKRNYPSECIPILQTWKYKNLVTCNEVDRVQWWWWHVMLLWPVFVLFSSPSNELMRNMYSRCCLGEVYGQYRENVVGFSTHDAVWRKSMGSIRSKAISSSAFCSVSLVPWIPNKYEIASISCNKGKGNTFHQA